METCKVEGYGIPTWGPNRKTKGLLATGTYMSPSDPSDQESLLRISKYDINSPNGLVL